MKIPYFTEEDKKFIERNSAIAEEIEKEIQINQIELAVLQEKQERVNRELDEISLRVKEVRDSIKKISKRHKNSARNFLEFSERKGINLDELGKLLNIDFSIFRKIAYDEEEQA